VLEQSENVQRFVDVVIACLHSDDDELKWKAARVIEELVLWVPGLVDDSVLEAMAYDPDWTLRSSAALCYFELAAMNPAAIPIKVVHDLAAHNEDWYVSTPATHALLRMTRARPIVIDLLAVDLQSDDKQARRHAAHAVELLTVRDWDLVSDDLLSMMAKSDDPHVREAGQKCSAIKQEHAGEPPRDYSHF
jgi:hypothetical protein